MMHAEGLHARGVDQRTARIQMVELGMRGGVFAGAQRCRHFAGLRCRARNQLVEDGGFTHTRFADQHAAFAVKLRPQRVDVVARHQFQQRITQCGERREHRLRGCRFRQFGLVEHDQHFDAGVSGRGETAIEHVEVE